MSLKVWRVLLSSSGELVGVVETSTPEEALGAAIVLAARSDKDPERLRVERTSDPIVKRHGCGVSFTLEAWENLAFGYTQRLFGEVQEFRHCVCGSTVGLYKPPGAHCGVAEDGCRAFTKNACACGCCDDIPVLSVEEASS